MTNEPTILVKKADGTFIHVPLSQLQKNKKTLEQNNTKTSEQAAVKIVKPSAPNASKLTEQIAPAKIVAPLAPIKHDLTSPLEEPLPSAGPAVSVLPLTSQGREGQVEYIMKSLSFKVPAGNSNRLRTIIQLFLKDIRGERETVEILTRREIEGGVGLSAVQAEEVINKSEESISDSRPASSAGRPSTAPKFDPKESARLEQEVPAVIRKTTPMVAPMKKVGAPPVFPAQAGIHNRELTGVDSRSWSGMTPKATTTPSTIVTPKMSPAATARLTPEFKISSAPARTTMTDVKPSLEFTPVDEIRNFSLTDFRRIAATPADAAARLKQKFMNLKDESIILFFQALDAWRASPLYSDYLTAVSESLAKRAPLGRNADKLKIQLPEITALVEMERGF